MPASQTITAFYEFTPLTVIRSAQVNNNFGLFRGHLLAVDGSAASFAHHTYDLGSYSFGWRGVYSQYGVMYGNTTGSVPATPSAGYYAIYFKNDGKMYRKNSSNVENEIGGGALVVTGSRAFPMTITAAGGVGYSATAGARQQWFVMGDTTTGTVITANPQIPAANDVGQELLITGRDSTRPVTFANGNGLNIDAEFVANEGSQMMLNWDGTEWQLQWRRF